ncbi:hexose kinase [Tetragenococcus halophilus]|uniref:hexose kinase n=1 Tax=Tetragenococcus halophilus TaxID=51669 RepID=UPI00209A7559|nr:hexose kinase [Tetragenococcus halophilus]MCO8290611.1 hexose kinase [Tetragenococcus halophilus]MCT8310371.1 hexose kinase [Tetragenococcus halophilus]
MILTITMNPSIDISYPLEKLVIDRVNRVNSVSKTAGGKGLNVTRVLCQLNEPVKASGMLGGNFGQFIREHLDEEGIKHDFSEISSETRNSIAILHEENQTEILESGPEISKNELNTFFETYKRLLREVDIVTISGSLPRGVRKDYYSILIEEANRQSTKTILDTSGETLTKSIQGDSKPYLIKPNEEEISQVLGYKINARVDLKNALKSDLFNDIEWVVVSLGKDGALVKHKKTIYKIDIPSIEVINPVGSGDATLAGLTYGISSGRTPEEIMRAGMVAGMLNTMNQKTGHIDVQQFDQLLIQVSVNKINGE